MIDLTKINEVYLFSKFIDFRLGINSLAALVVSENSKDSIKGNLYLFCNKKRTQIKILEFDSTGIWLYIKKLSNTKFVYPEAEGTYIISKENLNIILNGLDFIAKIDKKYDLKQTYF